MPTKPDPIADFLPPWATAGNYPASNYQAFLPWGDANPLGAGPTPWGLGPRLKPVGLDAVAAQGYTPEIPTEAEPVNEWLRRVQLWVDWVKLGTSDPDADAHVVETDGAGTCSALVFEATTSFEGAAASPAPLSEGATVPTGKTLGLSGTASIALTDTAKITAVTGTIIESGRFEFIAGSPAPDPRQVAMGSNGILGINTGSGLEQNHQSTSGWVYATGDQEAETALQVTIFTATTTEALLALGVGGNVRVIVYGQGQRSVAGAVTIDVQEDQGSGTWTDIGTGQLIDWIDTASATAWTNFRHERVFAAGTLTAKFYRLKITSSGGPTAKAREVRLKVVNERA